MRSNIARYSFSFVLVHWALALISAALLGLGWYIQYIQPTAPERSSLLDLHMSLGITSAIVITILLFLQIIFKRSLFPNEFKIWRRVLARTLYLFIYASFILMLISGYLQAVFSATPIRFWGAPMPVWGAADPMLAEYSIEVHRITAFILAGLIIIHACISIINIFKRPGIVAPEAPPEAQESHELVVREAKSLIADRIAQGLAKILRLFGWIGFWLQFVFALISALLLAFATSGRTFSPGSTGFGDGIYLAGYAFLLLCFAVLLAFYYTRLAKMVASKPDSYLSQKNKAAFWLLGAGVLIGLLGILISFSGVALSITLLIAKTVSQPPGIAITDPNKIIRALDVFVLLVNFILLMAHFIGTGLTLLLSLMASKARFEYVAVSENKV